MKIYKKELLNKALIDLYMNGTVSNKNVESYIMGWEKAEEFCEEKFSDTLKKLISYYSLTTSDNTYLKDLTNYYNSDTNENQKIPDSVFELVTKHSKIISLFRDILKEIEEIQTMAISNKLENKYIGNILK
jgi:hypothetical protein